MGSPTEISVRISCISTPGTQRPRRNDSDFPTTEGVPGGINQNRSLYVAYNC